MYKPQTTFEISGNIVFRRWKGDGHFVLIEIQGDNLFELHDMSAVIWQLIVDKHDYQGILSSIAQEFQPFGASETKDVENFINELVEKNILKIIS